MAKLGDVCEILNGFSFKSDQYTESGIRIIRIANVQNGYIEDLAPVFYPLDDKNALKYELAENDLLISLTGNVGRVGILTKRFLPAALNQRVACIRIKNEFELEKTFLFHFLNSENFEQACIHSSKGVAQKNMSTEWLKDYIIPIPPLDEQRRIAAVLDKVSDLIDKRRQQLDKLDLLVKSKFVEMFVLGDNWPERKIDDLCVSARTGPFGSALHHDEFVDKGIFVLGIDNAVDNKFSYKKMRYITAEKYEQLKRYTVHSGDVIITIMGTVGRSAVIPEDIPTAINTKHLACLTPNKRLVDPYFLCCAFQIHPDIIEQLTGQATGAIMDGLNLTKIRSIHFHCPPLELQSEFVALYHQVDKSKSTIQQSLEKLKTLKKAWMQEYFG